MHVNLMGRRITLADVVEWRIGADKKKRRIRVSRIVERLGDYANEFHDTKENSRYKEVNQSASHAELAQKSIIFNNHVGQKSPRHLSNRNVKFRLPEQEGIIDIRTSSTTVNMERQNLFESKPLLIPH